MYSKDLCIMLYVRCSDNIYYLIKFMNPYQTPLKAANNIFSSAFTPSPDIKKNLKTNLSSINNSSPSKKSQSSKRSIINIQKIEFSSYIDNFKRKTLNWIAYNQLDLTLGSCRYLLMVTLIFYNLFSLTSGVWELLGYFSIFFGLKIINPSRGTKARLFLNLSFVLSLNYFFLNLMDSFYSMNQWPRLFSIGTIIHFANVVNYVDSESYLELIFQFIVEFFANYCFLNQQLLRTSNLVVQGVSFICAFFLFTEFVHFHNTHTNLNKGDAYIVLQDDGSAVIEVKTNIVDQDKFTKLIESKEEVNLAISKAKIQNFSNSKIDITQIFSMLCKRILKNPKSAQPSPHNYLIFISDGFYKNSRVSIISIYATKIKSKKLPSIPKSRNIIKFEDADDYLTDESEEDIPRVEQSPSKLYKTESQLELSFTSPTIYRSERPEFVTFTKTIDNLDIEDNKAPLTEEERLREEEKSFDRRLLHFTIYGEIDERYEDSERYMDLLRKIYKKDGENMTRIKIHALEAIIDVYGKPSKEDTKEAYEEFKKSSKGQLYSKYNAKQLYELDTVESRRLLKFKWEYQELNELKKEFFNKLQKLKEKNMKNALFFQKGKYEDSAQKLSSAKTE